MRVKRFKQTALLGVLLAASLCLAGCLCAQRRAAAMTGREAPVTVVLDPGHGGEDGGAVSVSGGNESSLNLEISLRMRDLFRFAGIPVKMTRETDVSLCGDFCGTLAEKKLSDLKRRAGIVGETERALLVSIHQNQFPEEKYRGTQVFYAGTPGSEELAQRIQDTVRGALDPRNHRQIKRAQSVYLMEHIGCTGVLVECGFLSNEAEDALLRSPDYQKKLAAAICGSVAAYLTEEGNSDEV